MVLHGAAQMRTLSTLYPLSTLYTLFALKQKLPSAASAVKGGTERGKVLRGASRQAGGGQDGSRQDRGGWTKRKAML